MAPTLQGRHKDVWCPQCEYRYMSGASSEVDESGRGPVVAVTCPMCGYEQEIDRRDANQRSFSGDRILVNKFAYQYGEPSRWDVIVFKFPGNAKQNYIKRLVGLPNETLMIRGGDVYSCADDTAEFQILRKPPRKLLELLQTVHDTRYIPQAIIDAKWPARWFSSSSNTANVSAADESDEGTGGWIVSPDRRMYSLSSRDEESWLRYRHVKPLPGDWRAIKRPQLSSNLAAYRGELINDYYAYNAYRQSAPGGDMPRSGWHWVGDLAVEAKVKVKSEEGELQMELVEGGHRFRAAIDVRSGLLTLTIDGGKRSFEALAGATGPTELTAATSLKSRGTYRLRFANVDNQLLFWLNERLVQLKSGADDHPGYFELPSQVTPQWSADNAGDLYPVGIGGRQLDADISQLRVARDIYYIATRSLETDARMTSPRGMPPGMTTDYQLAGLNYQLVQQIFREPESWGVEQIRTSGGRLNLFERRQSEEFTLEQDQFFPMGDNNPQSQDARLWGGGQMSLFEGRWLEVPHYVERSMLIGKAFLVYWPHGWNAFNIPLPIIPNVSRMGRIR